MSIQLNDNLIINAGKPVDSKYLSLTNVPYTSTTEVNATIPIASRSLGLTVNIDNVEYWYATGVSNSDLVLKTSSGLTINDYTNVGSGIGIFSGVTENGDVNLRTLLGSGSTIVSLSGDTIIVHSSNLELQDGILKYDEDDKTFTPFSAYTSGITLYLGDICPDNIDRLNLNARLTVTGLKLSTGCTAITGVTHQPGELFWDSENDTISLQQTADVQQQIGQELYIKGTNSGASVIENGQVVYVSGSVSGKPTIVPARANELDINIVEEVVGMVTEDIPAGEDGFVTTNGIVGGLNTTGLTVGDVVYLSPTEFGGVTNVKPTYPDFVVEIGIVLISDATDGKILIKIIDRSIRQVRGAEVVNVSEYTATTRTDFIAAYDVSDIYLPESPLVGQQITIVDSQGNAETNIITIHGNGNDILDDTFAEINTNWGGITLLFNGFIWNVVSFVP
ncbi:MAG: hypothetical protein ACOC22_00960 [bacterium]